MDDLLCMHVFKGEDKPGRIEATEFVRDTLVLLLSQEGIEGTVGDMLE